MHKFLACICKSQDFAQGQKNFARSHDHTTARFRNSAKNQIQVLDILERLVKILLLIKLFTGHLDNTVHYYVCFNRTKNFV